MGRAIEAGIFTVGLGVGMAAGYLGAEHHQENEESAAFLHKIAEQYQYAPEMPFTNPNIRIVIDEAMLEEIGMNLVTIGESRTEINNGQPGSKDIWVHEGAFPDMIVRRFHEAGFPKVINVPFGEDGSTSTRIREKLQGVSRFITYSEKPSLVISHDTGNKIPETKHPARTLAARIFPHVAGMATHATEVSQNIETMTEDNFVRDEMIIVINQERKQLHLPPLIALAVFYPEPFSFTGETARVEQMGNIPIPVKGPFRDKVIEFGNMVTGGATIAIGRSLEMIEEAYPTDQRDLLIRAFAMNHLVDPELYDTTFHFGPKGVRAVRDEFLDAVDIRKKSGIIVSFPDLLQERMAA